MAANFSITLDPASLANARRVLSTAQFKVRMRAAMREAVLYAQRQIVGRTPADTGRLRASIGIGAVTDVYGEIKTSLPYASDVEFPTRPHQIRPRRAKALSWPGAQHPVRMVNHPGTKGAHMFERTAASEQAAIIGIFQRRLTE